MSDFGAKKTQATEAKHTPGPWTVRANLDCEVLGVLGGLEVRVAHANAFGGPVGMAAANARLIAAAPEMLATLKRCISALAANGAPNCEAAKEARLAVAKAEGRS